MLGRGLVMAAVLSVGAAHVLSAVHGAERAAVAGAGGARVKRQLSFSGRLCFSECMDDFKTFLEAMTDGDLDLDDIQKGFFDKSDLFDDQMFLPSFCGEYRNTTQCIEQCGSFDGDAQVKAQLKSLDFMCVQHYDKFVEYQPCYRNLSASGADEQCKAKCGGEDFVGKQVAQLENFGSTPDFGALMGIMGSLCGFIQCHLDCQRPHYVKVCGTNEPAELLDDFIAVTIGSAMGQLTQLGLGELVPASCRALGGDEDAKSELAGNELGFSKDADAAKTHALEREKLDLEIGVLEKQDKKLDKEIKKLDAELKLVDKQTKAADLQIKLLSLQLAAAQQ